MADQVRKYNVEMQDGEVIEVAEVYRTKQVFGMIEFLDEFDGLIIAIRAEIMHSYSPEAPKPPTVRVYNKVVRGKVKK